MGTEHEAALPPDPQWIDKRKVHAMIQHEYDNVPNSVPVKDGGWQGGLPHPERRYLDGFKAGVAYIDRVLGGWGWASTSGVSDTVHDDERVAILTYGRAYAGEIDDNRVAQAITEFLDSIEEGAHDV